MLQLHNQSLILSICSPYYSTTAVPDPCLIPFYILGLSTLTSALISVHAVRLLTLDPRVNNVYLRFRTAESGHVC